MTALSYLSRRRLGAGLALLCASPLVLAQTPANVLGRIQQAAVMRNYQGTLMFSAGGVLSSTKLLHIGDGRDHYDRIETLDGQPRVQYRHNEEMLTLWPDSRLARWEQREPVAEFPALPASAEPRALENYELQALESDRVAGHTADVLMLKPRDAHRYAQRLWADHQTGLLLRNDVLAPGGEVLESSVFTDLQIGGKPSAEAVLGPMKRLAGYRVLRPRSERAQVETEGWQLVRPVPGFGLVSCTKRPLADAGVPVLQSVFSDGLTHVSVFIERYDAQRHKQPLATGLGATHTLMNRHGDWWFTVVGEVPMATVQLFEAMFERRR